MKWINHTIIAGSLTAIINPLAVPSAIIGGVAPDLLEKVLAVKHRRISDEQDGKNAEFTRPVLVLRKFNHSLFLGIPLTTNRKNHPLISSNSH